MDNALQFPPRGKLGLPECLFIHPSARKKPQAVADATHVQRLELDGFDVLPDNQLGRPATNIHHQLLQSRVGQGMRHPQINQPCFFAAGNDLNREPQCLFRLEQKLPCILRHTQGVGRYRAHRGLVKTTQALGKNR